MKTVMRGALALALLAGSAGAALAQEQPESEHDRWHDAGERPRPPQRTPAPAPQPAPQAAPQAPRSGAPGPWNEPQARYGPRPQTQAQPQPQPQPQAQAPNTSGPGGWRRGPDGQTWRGGDAGQRRDGGRAWTQPAPQAAPVPAPAPDRRADDRRRWEQDRRDGDRRDWDRDRRDGDRRDWNRNDRRDWERERPRYDPRHYPRSFHSPQRYRGYFYRPPPGFYMRSWAFGDFLPRAWWTPDYLIDNWWDYGLPIPPIGYDWVRVGDDALLIDSYSGRVVQVVYDVFW